MLFWMNIKINLLKLTIKISTVIKAIEDTILVLRRRVFLIFWPLILFMLVWTNIIVVHLNITFLHYYFDYITILII